MEVETISQVCIFQPRTLFGGREAMRGGTNSLYVFYSTQLNVDANFI